MDPTNKKYLVGSAGFIFWVVMAYQGHAAWGDINNAIKEFLVAIGAYQMGASKPE